MSQRAQEFGSSKDAYSACPNLDNQCAIPIIEFDGIVGRCVFSQEDHVRCQLQNASGAVCKQEHGRGWVARRKDGKEGFIGKDCAHRYFGTDSQFKEAAARATREIKIDSAIARIRERLEDPNYQPRVQTLRAQHEEISQLMQRYRRMWPDNLYQVLLNMAKTRNRDVLIEVRYIEKDDDGRALHRWEPTVLGRVSSPGIFSSSTLSDAEMLIRAAEVTLIEAKPSPDAKLKQLEHWAISLESVERSEALLSEVQRELAAFNSPENLKLLCWLVRSDDDTLSVIARAVEILNGASISAARALEIRREWSSEIRQANSGRDFRHG